MFRRAVVLATLIAAVSGPTVAVGGAAEPILKLALQYADMPPTTGKPGFGRTNPESSDVGALRPFGAREHVGYRYSWPAGGTLNTPIGPVEKQWVIAGDVYRSADESGAKRLFALGKAAKTGHFSYDDFPSETAKPLTMPAYGDEQIALVTTHPGIGTSMMVFVRTRTVGWQVRVAAIPLQFQPTAAEMRAILETYAAKQKARVAAGN
jgi:hypothetical protein